MTSRSTRALFLLAAASLASLGAASSASAAWFDAGDVADTGAGGRVLPGPAAGQVAVAGVGADGVARGRGHVPGGAFGPLATLAAGNEDFPSVIGPGGAIISTESGVTQARRLRPDGSASAPRPVADADFSSTSTGAVAPSGALVTAVSDGDGALQLWRQASESTAPVAIGAAFGEDVSIVDIASFGADGFVVVWVERREAGGQRVRSTVVQGSTVGASRTLQVIPSDDENVDDVHAVGSGSPIVAWTVSSAAEDGPPTKTVAASAVAGGPTDLGTGLPGGFVSELRSVQVAGGGAAVAWASESDEGVESRVVSVGPDSAKRCEVARPVGAITLVDRGGPTAVELGTDGRIGAVPISPATCAPGAASPGPVVDGAGAVDAAVDADGAIVALVGLGEGGSRILVDDVTPPTLDPFVPPRIVGDGQPLVATARPADAWGVRSVSWTLDGAPVADAERTPDGVRIANPAEGDHQVAVTATNTAGSTARREGRTTVDPSAPPTSTPVPRTPDPDPTPAPGAPAPASPSPATPRTPTVRRPVARVVAIERHRGRWTVVLRQRRGTKVRLALFRERYQPGSALNGRTPTCPAPHGGRRPETGRIGVTRVRVARTTSRIRLPRSFDAALRRRGRYTVTAIVSAKDGARSTSVLRRITTCG